MIQFRGDAHKFYLKIRKSIEHQSSLYELSEIQEINEIQSFYRQFTLSELIKIKYKMQKEKNGSGILPLLVSSLPWLLLIFSKQLNTFLLKEETMTPVVLFILTYILTIIISIVMHFKERSWATIHIEIIQDLIQEKLDKTPNLS